MRRVCCKDIFKSVELISVELISVELISVELIMVAKKKMVKKTKSLVVVEEVADGGGIKSATDVGFTGDLDLGVAKPEVMVDEEPQTMIQGNEVQQNMEDKMEDKKEETSENIWSDSAVTSSKKSGSRGILIGLIVIFLLIAGVGGGYYLYKASTDGATEEIASEEKRVKEELSTSTPTPTVAFDRSEWKIEVLNGTMTSGLAAKVAADLEKLGYKVVKIGNVPKKIETTEVYVNAGMKTKQAELIDDLEGDWGIEEVSGTLEDSTASARIVLGGSAVEEEEE